MLGPSQDRALHPHRASAGLPPLSLTNAQHTELPGGTEAALKALPFFIVLLLLLLFLLIDQKWLRVLLLYSCGISKAFNLWKRNNNFLLVWPQGGYVQQLRQTQLLCLPDDSTEQQVRAHQIRRQIFLCTGLYCHMGLKKLPS